MYIPSFLLGIFYLLIFLLSSLLRKVLYLHFVQVIITEASRSIEEVGRNFKSTIFTGERESTPAPMGSFTETPTTSRLLSSNLKVLFKFLMFSATSFKFNFHARCEVAWEVYVFSEGYSCQVPFSLRSNIFCVLQLSFCVPGLVHLLVSSLDRQYISIFFSLFLATNWNSIEPGRICTWSESVRDHNQSSSIKHWTAYIKT